MTMVITKEFKETDFACQCGCGLGYSDMKDSSLSKLFTARKSSGVPFRITSAVRCEKHNTKVGGKPNSSHKRGYGIDIAYTDMLDLHTKVHHLLKAGFPRLGINFAKQFVHVDDDPSLPKGIFPY